ncbi:MAG: DUF3500 domain-containing protein [Anaerolineae bacterium]|nr:DUF3500 domain-containing protein [Anaerolineae bacterium]
MRVTKGIFWLWLAVVLILAGCSTPQIAVQPTVAPTTAAAKPVATTAPSTAPVQSSPTAAAKPAATTVPPTAPAASPSVVAKAATTVATTAPTTGATVAAASPSASGSATSGAANAKIVAAANAFLATLDANQKSSVLFDWSNTAQKQRWSNLPQGLYQRAGLMWGNLNQAQQTAWLAVLQTTLSAEGYNRVMAEWNADDALAAAQGSGGGGGPGGQLLFGKQYYWVALIGTPSTTSPWQWQWGGHHVTINAIIVGPNISLTPSFIGCQPCTYTDASGKTMRPLGDIEDEAFALVNSLNATQQKTAVLGNRSIDLVLRLGRTARLSQPERAARLADERRPAGGPPEAHRPLHGAGQR